MRAATAATPDRPTTADLVPCATSLLCSQLTDHDYDRFIKMHDLVIIAFGAPWCPWSQRLEPIYRKTHEELKKKHYGESVRMARVDCTQPTCQTLCSRQHIHAFPTIRVHRHKMLHTHENYLGDRSSESLLAFIEESLPHKREGADSPLALQQRVVSGQAVEEGLLDGEGCQLTGSVRISRVPGHLKVRAARDEGASAAEHGVEYSSRVLQ